MANEIRSLLEPEVPADPGTAGTRAPIREQLEPEASPVDPTVPAPRPSIRDQLEPAVSPTERAYRETLNVDPVRAAKVRKLSEKLDENPAFVDQNLEQIEKVDAAPPSDFWKELERDSPAFSKWASLQKNMAVAKDDLDKLGFFESQYRQLTTGFAKGNLESRQRELWFERMSESRATRKESLKYQTELDTLDKDLAPYNEFDAKVGKNFHPTYKFAGQIPNLTRPFIRAGAGEMDGSDAGLIPPAAAGALAGGAIGLAVPVPGAAATGFGLGALAGSGIYAYRTEAGGAFSEYSTLKDPSGKAIDPGIAADVAHSVGLMNGAIETGADLVLLKVAKPLGKLAAGIIGDAATKALTKARIPGSDKIVGIINSKPELFTGMTLGRAIREAGKLWALGIASEVGTEYTQEVITGLGGDDARANSGLTEMKGLAKIAEDATAVIPDTAQSMLVFGALGGGAHIANSRREMKQAEQVKSTYLAMGKAANAISIKETLPSAVQEFVSEVTKDGPVQHVSITPEAMETYFQGKKIDSAQAFKELGIEKEVADAKDSNQKVQIPIAKWLTLVPTEHHAGLADDISFSPETPSVNEAKGIQERVDSEIEGEFKKADEAIKADQSRQASFDAVQKSITEKLIAAKPREMLPDQEKIWKRQVDAAAKVWAARATAEASRRGITTEEYYASIEPQIVNEAGSAQAKAETLQQERIKAPAFYSKLSKMVDEKMGNKATVEQVRALMRDASSDDVKYSGIEGFLAGKDKVSKEELQDFLAENQIQIQTVQKGVNPEMGIQAERHQARWSVAHEKEEKLRLAMESAGIIPQHYPLSSNLFILNEPETIAKIEEAGVSGALKEYSDAIEATRTVEDAYSNVESWGDPKYSQYTLPGGENYREILFTLPQKPMSYEEYRADYMRTAPGIDEETMLERYPDYLKDPGTDLSRDNYRSGHWEENNVLAFVRLKDRTDADGKKVLFVEEIQSDWHQAGRKRGYKSDSRPEPKPPNYQSQVFGDDLIVVSHDLQWQVIVKRDGHILNGQSTTVGKGVVHSEDAAKDYALRGFHKSVDEFNIRESREYQEASRDNRVPDAPFKKTWHEFALKKILRMAAEGGYDRVAWTTGEQQAERYDLSKQVDAIKLTDMKPANGEGFHLTAFDKDGNTVFGQRLSKIEDAEEFVGKEVTQKLLESEYQEDDAGMPVKTVSGADLKVGGDGMKGFYDKILPSFLNKYTKKWGGKVSEARISSVPDGAYYAGQNSLDEWALFYATRGSAVPQQIDTFRTRGLAQEEAEILNAAISQETKKVHSLDITPEMKASVLNEGQTLFQGRLEPIHVQTQVQFPETVDVVKAKSMIPNTLFEGSDSKEAKRPVQDAAFKWAMEHLKGKSVLNVHTGEQILIDKRSIQKAKNRARTAPQVVLMMNMDKLLETAVFVSERPVPVDKPDIAKSFLFYGSMDFAGKRYVVHLGVNEMKRDGTRVYDPDVVGAMALPDVVENEKPAGQTRDGTSEEELRDSGNSGSSKVSIAELLAEINEARATNPLFQDEDSPRGQIQFGASGPVISLFRAADASTFLHESAHLWLKDQFDYVKANEGKLPAQYLKDWKVLSEWLGVAADQAALTVEQQEQFARGFEAYLREGKAPSKALKRVFRSLRMWLSRLYKDVKALNVELSDPVRQVMDRMLSTEAEIAEAQAEAGHTPGMQTKIEGLAPEVTARLERLQEEAHEEAVGILLRRQLEEIKADRQAFLAERRTELEKEVRARLQAQGVYKLEQEIRDFFNTRKTGRLVAREFLEQKLSEEDGASFEAQSEIWGFSSGDELAKFVTESPTLDSAVGREVTTQMTVYADLRDTAGMKEEAMKAIHTEHSMELMSLEHEVLSVLVQEAQISEEAKKRKAAEAKIEAKAIKERARELMWKLNIRSATATKHLYAAEKRAAISAAKAIANKEWDAAEIFKRQQMLNHALAMESTRIAEKVGKWQKFLNELRTRDAQGFKKEEHFHQVSELLHRLGYDRRDYNPDARQETLAQWIAKAEADTNILSIPNWVQDESKLRPEGELTITELEDVVNSIKNILKVANFEDRAMKLDRGATLTDIKQKLRMAFSLGKKGRTRPKPRMGGPSNIDLVKSGGAQYLLSLVRIQNIFRSMQGFEQAGAWTDIWQKPVDDAASEESRLLEWANAGMKSIFSVYSKKEQQELLNRRVFYPELGTSIPKMTLIMMALNLGNDGNRTKLFATKSVGFNAEVWDEQVGMALLSRELSARDWAFVQSTWDLIGERWGDISALHKRMTGFSPGKVAAAPFNVLLPSGEYLTMRGGYFPLKQDARADLKADIREELDAPLYTEKNPGWMAVTKTGHTKTRTEANYSVSLDHSIIHRHLRDVIHDIAFRELVTDFRRLISDPEIVDMVKDSQGDEGYAIVKEWVASVATGRSEHTSDFFGRFVAGLRRRTTAAVLTFKLANIVQNFANVALYANSGSGFSNRDVAAALLGRGLPYVTSFFTNRKAYEAQRELVFGLSRFMADKHQNPDFSLAETQAAVFQRRGVVGEYVESKLGQDSAVVAGMDKLSGANEAVKEFGQGLMAGTDEATSIPVWLHAYNLALDRDMDREEAVRYADGIIRDAIGSGRKYDTATIQRGGEMAKTMSMFMTFINAEFNRWYVETGRARLEGGDSHALVALMKNPKYMGFVASRLIAFNVISLLLSGKGPGDDEDSPVLWWLKQSLFYPISFFPGVRDVADVALDQVFGLQSFGFKNSPAAAGAKAGLDSLRATVKVAKGEGEVSAMVESLSKLLAFMAPYPDQFNAWFWNAFDIANGTEPKASDLYKRRPKTDR